MNAQLFATLTPTASRALVVAGAHAGASFDLDRRACRIGSDLACDVVLSDAAIAPEHFVLSPERGGRVRIEAIGGAVLVDGTALAQGTGCLARLPARLAIGEVALDLRPTQPVATPLRAWLDRRAAWAAGSLAGVALCLYPFLAMSGASSRPAPLPEAMPAAVATLPSPTEPLDALRSQLADAGLESLRLDADGSYVQISGTLDAEAMTRWRDVQRWFDRSHGDTHLLHAAVTERQRPPAPRVRVQAIWNGPNPYVIGEHGERLYPGAAMADGWVLSAIEADRLLLRRDGAEYALTL